MATTTNYGWTTPDDTALVKDGASAIRTLGTAIDTTTFNNAAAAIAKTIVDAKGDLIAATAADTVSRLAVGANGSVLVADSAEATGLKYQAATVNTVIDAKGDLLAGTAADTIARLAVGANDLVISAASGEATGLKYTGGWTSYTPTLTNCSLGNGTLTAKYRQIGKIVDVYFNFLLGSTSTISSSPNFSLPVSAVVGSILYNAYFQDAGTNTYMGGINLATTTAEIYIPNVSGTYPSYAAVSSTVPFTWTTNDFIRTIFSYEVA